MTRKASPSPSPLRSGLPPEAHVPNSKVPRPKVRVTAPVEFLPAPRCAAQEQTVHRGPKATTVDSKRADPVVPPDLPATTADSKRADPVVPTDLPATTADSKQADPVDPTDPVVQTDPPAKTADSGPTDPVDPTEWAEQPRLSVPKSPLTGRGHLFRSRPSQSLLFLSQASSDRALTVQHPMVLRPVARLPTSHGTLKALDPSTLAAKADSTPNTDPKAVNAPAHRI